MTGVRVQLGSARRVLFVGVMFVAACDPPKDERREKEKQVESAAEALKRAQQEECGKFSTAPNTLLETSGLQYHDKGIINDYRQLTGVTVLNKARYCAVRRAEGDITWFDAAGKRFGSTPFTLTKSIAAGATERFSTDEKTMTSGTLEGAATKATISFTRVEVVAPP